MKRVDIEFVNIQSHEHTKFHLQPGLNFILAEDNNVGKSTIFKVIMFAMQLPKIDGVEPNELIRGGCTSAKAVFTVEGVEHTLWLFREGTQARAFFETKDKDGSTMRSYSAPADLREALDIVCSNDGKVVNFNDADSIQLIVQDTSKNDEVLSKVLIDFRVEGIKDNMGKLSQEVSTDARIIKARYDDAARVLSTMHHCPAVGTFYTEYSLLAAGCRVLDALEEPCHALDNLQGQRDMDTLNRVDRVLSILPELDVLSPQTETVVRLYNETFKEAEVAFEVYKALLSAFKGVRAPIPSETASALESAERTLKVLEPLSSGLASMSRAFNNGSKANTLYKEIAEIDSKLAVMSQRVQCPIKGEVFYTHEKCIPTGD